MIAVLSLSGGVGITVPLFLDGFNSGSFSEALVFTLALLFVLVRAFTPLGDGLWDLVLVVFELVLGLAVVLEADLVFSLLPMIFLVFLIFLVTVLLTLLFVVDFLATPRDEAAFVTFMVAEVLFDILNILTHTGKNMLLLFPHDPGDRCRNFKDGS